MVRALALTLAMLVHVPVAGAWCYDGPGSYEYDFSPGNRQMPYNGDKDIKYFIGRVVSIEHDSMGGGEWLPNGDKPSEASIEVYRSYSFKKDVASNRYTPELQGVVSFKSKGGWRHLCGGHKVGVGTTAVFGYYQDNGQYWLEYWESRGF